VVVYVELVEEAVFDLDGRGVVDGEEAEGAAVAGGKVADIVSAVVKEEADGQTEEYAGSEEGYGEVERVAGDGHRCGCTGSAGIGQLRDFVSNWKRN